MVRREREKRRTINCHAGRYLPATKERKEPRATSRTRSQRSQGRGRRMYFGKLSRKEEEKIRPVPAAVWSKGGTFTTQRLESLGMPSEHEKGRGVKGKRSAAEESTPGQKRKSTTRASRQSSCRQTRGKGQRHGPQFSNKTIAVCKARGRKRARGGRRSEKACRRKERENTNQTGAPFSGSGLRKMDDRPKEFQDGQSATEKIGGLPRDGWSSGKKSA